LTFFVTFLGQAQKSKSLQNQQKPIIQTFVRKVAEKTVGPA